MRRRAYLTLACLLVAFAGSVAPAAAEEHDGLPIRRVEFEGLERLAEESVLFYLDLEEGRPLDWALLNQRIHELWERELVDDVKVESFAEGDGVRLVVHLLERPVLRAVEYQGLKKISRTDVLDRVAKEQLRVREGDALNRGDLQRLGAVVEELYEEKGFRLAQALLNIDESGPGERRVIVSVDEGDKVRIADIDFEGNTVYSDRRLRWAMGDTKESGLISRVLKKDVYKTVTFEEDRDNVRDLYRKIGYKNVVLGEPKVEVKATNPNAADVRNQKRRLFLTIPVEEGARWKLGDIMIEGNETFPDEALLAQFKQPRGGWLRASVIDDGVETITEFYKNSGHLFAQVVPVITERDEQTADVTVQVDEGDQYKVGRLEFEGNVKTRDKVLRREMRVQEGLVLNSGALRNSLLRLGQLEFFKVDEDDPVAFNFNGEDKTVDLTIQGEEGDRTELLFGGGFSEIDGFFGQFSFRTRNFLGRGENLGISVQAGRRQDIFDLSYHIPWFLDRPQTVGVQVFKRDLDYNLLTGQALQSSSEGATFTYGRNLGIFRNLSLSYSLFDQEDLRSDFVSGELVTQGFARAVSTLRISHVFDRRDSRLQPTVGYRYNTSIDYAGGALGGDSNFARGRAGFTLYKPVTKGRIGTVAAVNVEAGYIRPFEEGELFFLDRFYLGGETSIRGFRFRSIWVRDENGNTVLDQFGFPLGGDRFFQANFEYIFLLGGPFRLILFADAGNVFLDSDDFSDFDYRYTAGIELQVNVPLFGAPLRFIYARNPDSYDDDRFESFQFSIGPSF